MLVRLLYASRAASALSPAVLDAILSQSRKNNPPKGITGLLCVGDQIFIQALEGGREEICDLYHTIVRDDRHKNLRLLAFDEIGERRFGGWTMAQVQITKINRALILKYFERPELDPFDAPGAATLALLSDLVATAAIAQRGE